MFQHDVGGQRVVPRDGPAVGYQRHDDAHIDATPARPHQFIKHRIVGEIRVFDVNVTARRANGFALYVKYFRIIDAGKKHANRISEVAPDLAENIQAPGSTYEEKNALAKKLLEKFYCFPDLYYTDSEEGRLKGLITRSDVLRKAYKH